MLVLAADVSNAVSLVVAAIALLAGAWVVVGQQHERTFRVHQMKRELYRAYLRSRSELVAASSSEVGEVAQREHRNAVHAMELDAGSEVVELMRAVEDGTGSELELIAAMRLDLQWKYTRWRRPQPLAKPRGERPGPS